VSVASKLDIDEGAFFRPCSVTRISDLNLDFLSRFYDRVAVIGCNTLGAHSTKNLVFFLYVKSGFKSEILVTEQGLKTQT
jgi:hypothetical protein